MTELENKYRQSILLIMEKISKEVEVDLVIGVPFVNRGKDVQGVLSILEAGLDTYFPNRTVLIICAISPFSSSSKQVLDNYASNHEERILVTYPDKEISDRGWMIRSLIDVAHNLTADLLILEPSLLTARSNDSPEGLTTDWIELMYQPIYEGHAKFVLPRFKLSQIINNSIGHHFLFPLMASLFNLELRGCLGAGMGISRHLLGDIVNKISNLSSDLYEYGIDYWLIIRALELKADFAEVFLGNKPYVAPHIGLGYMFSQAAQVVFQSIGQSSLVWKRNPQAVRSALTIGPRENLFLQEISLEQRPYLNNFRRGFSRYYDAVWSRIFSEELSIQIRKAATCAEEDFSFPAALWAEATYESLISYHFNPNLEKEDLANSLTPLFEGRLAGFLGELATPTHCGLDGVSARVTACPFNANNNLAVQDDAFISRRPAFIEKWIPHKEALKPFLPEISYWEYIPGVPIILPHMVRSPSGKSARVAEIYEQLLIEYKEEFKVFTRKNLGLSIKDNFEKIGRGVRNLVQKTEENLDQFLLPGDVHSQKDIQDMADKIIKLYPFPESLSLNEEVAQRLIREHPPRNLITLWGYQDTDELLKYHNPLDVLALASWTEAARYTTWNSEWLRKNLKPEHFQMSPIKPLVVDHLEFPALLGMKEAPSLNHLTSRILINNLRPGSGGSFPKVRFLTIVLKNIIEAEQFGMIWESFQKDHSKDFGEKVVNSIEGHWGTSMFSAHSIFENIQHRILKDKLLEIARQDWGVQSEALDEARELLVQMAAAYHLGLTLPGGHFITCSLWSWASYSFKGGKGVPTPLSLMIERRWFNSELFFRCYEKVEGSRQEIYSIIEELMGQGREREDLAVSFLGAPTDSEDVIVYQKTEKDPPPAGKLTRAPVNPILTPVPQHQWESKYVLNCGAIRVNGDVHIFYRAVGDDGISRIGLALSKNGLQVDERLHGPIFCPDHESEKMGCEDPRLISMEGRVYMLYTAYDGVTPQIALASITEDDLIQQRWQHWHRHGLVFPGFPNKDAVLFPERFGGKLAMYHRIAPSIWVAFSDTFNTPWPRDGHKIIMGSRSGLMWDAVKIGAGAQPLKTRYGWLLIYHGVDYGLCYRLGVFLTSLDDPVEVLYRSPNHILEPEKSFEIGVSGHSWVPNVVFTCGAIPGKDKAILDDDDEILVYYGGAATVIGVASARVADLIPARIRENRSE